LGRRWFQTFTAVPSERQDLSFEMSIRGRIGQFLFMVGLISLMILVASFLTGDPQYWFLPFGLLGTLAGLLLMLRGRTPPPPSGRFRAIRTVQQKLSERGSRRNDLKEKR
jgi:hypothetical protein